MVTTTIINWLHSIFTTFWIIKEITTYIISTSYLQAMKENFSSDKKSNNCKIAISLLNHTEITVTVRLVIVQNINCLNYLTMIKTKKEKPTYV